ncbi:MAG: flagellar biosynthesis protein FliR [Clostridiales bacterium]|jgi:flagellar biosynthetic protein FliR|nr:flagellar biosynthesis protein FliR [Clostridiales bacterium]MDN5281359.1 flagellar biosynthesis protein FliR [Candidatus Ozemobacter sp.]
MTEAFFLKAVGMFLIAMVRFSGFFINMPVFGESTIPMRLKAGLSAFCALIATPHLLATQELPELSVPGYGLMIIREMTLGFCLGFVVLLIMDSLRLAGQIIGMQIGFSFVQVADPSSNRSLGIVSEFFQMMGSLFFLIIGGHLILLQAFFQSFDLISLDKLQITSGVVEEIILYSRMIFVCGLQIAMPIIGVILVGDVGLGIIARTVPKMNVFQVGFSLKILGGLIILIVLMPHVTDIIRVLINASLGEVNTLLNHMS